LTLMMIASIHGHMCIRERAVPSTPMAGGNYIPGNLVTFAGGDLPKPNEHIDIHEPDPKAVDSSASHLLIRSLVHTPEAAIVYLLPERTSQGWTPRQV
jgi:hypothetical protein